MCTRKSLAPNETDVANVLNASTATENQMGKHRFRTVVRVWTMKSYRRAIKDLRARGREVNEADCVKPRLFRPGHVYGEHD